MYMYMYRLHFTYVHIGICSGKYDILENFRKFIIPCPSMFVVSLQTTWHFATFIFEWKQIQKVELSLVFNTT